MTVSESKLFIPEEELSLLASLAKKTSYFLASPDITPEEPATPKPQITFLSVMGAIVSTATIVKLKPGTNCSRYSLIERSANDETTVDKNIGSVEIYDRIILSDRFGLLDRINSLVHHACVKFKVRLLEEVLLTEGHTYDPGHYSWFALREFSGRYYFEELTQGVEKPIEWTDVKRTLHRHNFISQNLMENVIYDIFLSISDKHHEPMDEEEEARTILGIKDLITEVNLALGHDTFDEVQVALGVASNKLKKFVAETIGTTDTFVVDLVLDRGLITLRYEAKNGKIHNYR